MQKYLQKREEIFKFSDDLVEKEEILVSLLCLALEEQRFTLKNTKCSVEIPETFSRTFLVKISRKQLSQRSSKSETFFRQINSLLTYLLSKTVTLTGFWPKMCERHSVEITEIYSHAFLAKFS